MGSVSEAVDALWRGVGGLCSSLCRGRSIDLSVRTSLHPLPVVVSAFPNDTVYSLYDSLYAQLQVAPSRPLRCLLLFHDRDNDNDNDNGNGGEAWPLSPHGSCRGCGVGAATTLAQCGLWRDASLRLLPESSRTVAAGITNACRDVDSVTDGDERCLAAAQNCVRLLVASFPCLNPLDSFGTSATAHCEAFRRSGAVEAIARLCLSPVPSNRACGTHCLKLLFAAATPLPPARAWAALDTAPLLIDLCKFVARRAPEHLPSLLECCGYIDPARLHISSVVCNLAPVVNDLASRLHGNLAHYLATGRFVSHPDLTSTADEFLLFVAHLCQAIANCNRHDNRHDTLEVEYREWLLQLFKARLQDVSDCLCKVLRDQQWDLLSSGHFNPLLTLLEALHTVATLVRQGAKLFDNLIESQRWITNLLVHCSNAQPGAGGNSGYAWLSKLRYSRQQLAMSLLPALVSSKHTIVVRRSNLLFESFESLIYVKPERLKGGISVEFAMEEARGPGVLREWFSLLCKELFNPQIGLFQSCPVDPRRFFPNPASGINTGHLMYFRFCGRIIALALMHKVEIDVVFDSTFFRRLAGLPVTVADVKDADPDLYNNWKKLLKMDSDYLDSDELGLTFSAEVEHLGSRTSVELCPGGDDIEVNSKNRHEYVDLLVKSYFVTPVTEQVKAFSQGFAELLHLGTCKLFYRVLNLEDFDLMLYGKDQDISVEDWKAHTDYHEYRAADKHIRWFWKIVSEMNQEKRKKLLHFSTSLSRLPMGGFSMLPLRFQIYKSSSQSNHLPTAHTCYYQLVLPPYPTFRLMREKLHVIVAGQLSEGFGFA